MLTILAVTFLIFIVIGVPVSIALGFASILSVLLDGSFPIVIIAQGLVRGLDSFPLLAIPFFILSAEILSGGGLSAILLRVAIACVGRIPGGLGYANIGGITLFSGISGSAIADVAGPGSVAIKMMKETGYSPRYAAALTASISVVGPIIPPSIIMVLYSLVDDRVSVGTLFVAGIVPGLIIAGAMCCVNFVYTARSNTDLRIIEKRSLADFSSLLVQSIPILVLPVFIIVSVHGGLATPTEASVIAVVYALIVGVFVYKTIRFSDIPKLVLTAAIASISVLMLLATAQLFSWVLTISQVPQLISGVFAALNQFEFLLSTMVLLLIVGMFLEPAPAILIVGPVLAPIAYSLGIDPTHFAIIFIVNVTIGMLTPPVGSLLFVTSVVSRIELLTLARSIAPIFLVHILVLAILAIFPDIVTWLPNYLAR